MSLRAGKLRIVTLFLWAWGENLLVLCGLERWSVQADGGGRFVRDCAGTQRDFDLEIWRSVAYVAFEVPGSNLGSRLSHTNSEGICLRRARNATLGSHQSVSK